MASVPTTWCSVALALLVALHEGEPPWPRLLLQPRACRGCQVHRVEMDLLLRAGGVGAGLGLQPGGFGALDSPSLGPYCSLFRAEARSVLSSQSPADVFQTRKTWTKEGELLQRLRDISAAKIRSARRQRETAREPKLAHSRWRKR
ncbi:endothelin-2 [Marmota marmota marmota]|uniref:endothelin-2 n=1 Tax=Marmota marmota marmota TaxID=9994 RepID=UPI002093CC54|nr:endothelin-2 [Marmota marmota marmota]